MRKKDSSSKILTDFEKLQQLLEGKFDIFGKQIQSLEHNQKISDQKNDDSYKDLRFKIMAEAAITRQNVEKNIRAEIQVANDELKSELKNQLENLEMKLSKRITYIADLITIQLGGKIENHDKRIKKIEKTVSPS